MADDVLAIDELLAPISEGEPAGPDLSSSNRYAEIEAAYAPPPTTLRDDDIDGAEFDRVVDLAQTFLRKDSKDLRVAGRLTAALIHEEGFAGLASGLDLLHALMEQYWEGLHPEPSSRAAVLSWIGSDDVSFTLYHVPLTESGHTYFHYKEWAEASADEDDAGASEAAPDELSAATFGQAFETTDRGWYSGVCSSLDRARTTLQKLDDFGKEKFAEVDERPPSYRELAKALQWVSDAGADLLGRKPAPPGSAAGPSVDLDVGGADSTGAPAGSPAAGAPMVAEPRDGAEAGRAAAVAARVLRAEDPRNPAPYLMLRGLRWGEVRKDGKEPDPRSLVAPTTQQRTQLKTLFLDQEWPGLLDAVEEIMATPAGRAWLDLQRYAVIAAERLGPEYEPVAASIRSALASLLKDVPSLLDATLMDDSSTASRDTTTWLESQGFGGAEGGDSPPEDASADTDVERAIRNATFARAARLARSGDPQGAIELLMDRAEHEGSERASFITRSEAAGIMVDHELQSLARPILDDLHGTINDHKLEDWEAGEIVGKPLALLMRCLGPQEGALRQQLYGRLAKLDPLLAMRASDDGKADAGNASPPPAQAAQEAPAEPETAESGDG